MNKNELTEYADYLLKTAMYKVNNIEEAQELVQEPLMAASKLAKGVTNKEERELLLTWLDVVDYS